MSKIPVPGIKDLPEAPNLRKMVGPSLILLGLGLGSGEVILWPYLVSNYGLGIIWGALVGITFQFFLNMEIERYALVKGESVFVGFARMFKYLPYWFIVSTFIGFGLPGIIAASAKIFAEVLHIGRFDLLAIALLVLIGAILSLGSILYKTVENFQKIVISISIPTIVILTFILSHYMDWTALGQGIVGRGEGFWFLPAGIPLLTFFGALAYSGAGGNLNLAQSFYVKDKGYGMGKYAGRIHSVLFGKAEKIELVGHTFDPNTENITRFKRWWRLVNIEHAVVFWGLGIFTIFMLGLLAYSTTYGTTGNLEGINFIINEGSVITSRIGSFFGTLFLLVAGLTLFGTQFTVLDSTSRIITENIVLMNLNDGREGKISKIYYTTLWLQIIFGITIFLTGFNEPRSLVVLGAVINASAMFVSFLLILLLNTRALHPLLRPNTLRRGMLVLAFLFFGVFVSYAILSAFGIITS